jgi:PAS domain S-box-containing protein
MTAAQAPIPASPPSAPNILIVDDTPANLRLLAQGLTQQGYAVRMAPNGVLALAAIEQSLPDLLLLDIRMPQLNGFQVCQRLKAQPHTQSIPVLFLSALQDSADKVKAFEYGGEDYITKPFQMLEVLARVRHHLQKRQLQQQLAQQQQRLAAQNQQLQQEIRDRQRTEATLSRERNLLRNVIETVPDPIFYKDLDGRYQLCNQACADFLGQPIDDILHRSDGEIVPTEAAGWMTGQDAIVLQTRRPLRYEEAPTVTHGRPRLFDTYKVPLVEPDGQMAGLIGICRDITDIKATENHLNRTASRLSTLIRSLQAGICVENERREIVLANQWFCDLFQIPLTPGELVGMDCVELAANGVGVWADPEVELTRIQAILAHRQPVVDEELQLADGRVFERDYLPIWSGDRLQGHLWQYRDITARKANERTLMQVSQALTDFSESLKQLHRLSLKAFDSFDALAEDYLQTGCRVLGFKSGVIGRVQDDQYVISAVQSDHPKLHRNFRCSLDDTLCKEAIRSQQTIIYEHLGSLPEMQDHPMYQALKFESLISTPIVVGDQIYGSLCFFSDTPCVHGFTNHEQEFIELMGQSIGKYIHRQEVKAQQQRAEAALRESEARFRQLAENIESVFWVLEPASQRFTYVSPAYERIWQRPLGGILANAAVWRHSLHPRDMHRMVAKQAAGGSYDEEYRIVWPDGTMRWIRDRAFALRNEQDEVYRLVGIAEDITSLKHQEQALRLIFEGTAAKTGQEFFSSLVRYIAQVLQVRYVLVGQALDTSKCQVLALWCDDRCGENTTLPLANSPCEQVFAGQTLFHPTDLQDCYPNAPHLREWGAQSYFGMPITNTQNDVIGHLAVLDDRPMVTDKKRALILRTFAVRAGAELERQLFEAELQQARDAANAANRAKSEFLANISHELRTPLNAILGFTQLALNGGDRDPNQSEYFSIINRSGEHLLALINDVLEMSKIEAGRITLNPHTFDLHALLQNLNDLFTLRASAKSLTLDVAYTPAVPQFVETDESKLRQVLINLVGNAVKFTEQGTVTLKVDVAADPHEGHRLVPGDHCPQISAGPRPMAPAAEISAGPADPADPEVPEDPEASEDSTVSEAILLQFEITDTGPGISPQEQQLLFEPFVQTAAGCRSQEGTGLGLPISQRFVQLLGGSLTLDTSPGDGSTFSFAIAAIPKPPPSTASSTLPTVTRHIAPDQSEYRILVVDDHPTNRQLLVHLLTTSGFSVREAADGLAAVHQARTWQPHLIWMDIRMPKLDGYGATRQIKALGLEPAPVIVALTASAFEEERQRVLQAGCEDFVRKPFQTEQIFQTMARHLPIRYVEPDPAMVPDPSPGSPSLPPPASPALSPAPLDALPPGWLQDLERAAMKGSDEWILQLAAILPPEHQPLSQQLTTWANNFQFDAILTWLSTQTPLAAIAATTD